MNGAPSFPAAAISEMTRISEVHLAQAHHRSRILYSSTERMTGFVGISGMKTKPKTTKNEKTEKKPSATTLFVLVMAVSVEAKGRRVGSHDGKEAHHRRTGRCRVVGLTRRNFESRKDHSYWHQIPS
ncbi:unnamed protein product [Linum trigynum]|uniref:Uncharacterized protein n=1 Tax=Linum trigynum TaxID=586398 RepID=A0AAV2D3R2_9ROSI